LRSIYIKKLVFLGNIFNLIMIEYDSISE